MSMNFTSESFKKTFVRSINAALKKLGLVSLDASYIKTQLTKAYENYLFDRSDFNAGFSFEINTNTGNADDRAVYIANNVIWLHGGYYISHSVSKSSGLAFTLRRVPEDAYQKLQKRTLIAIRYGKDRCFFSCAKNSNGFCVAVPGTLQDFENYVLYDITDFVSLNLRPTELKLECILDNTWGGYGLKLDISVYNPELSAMIECIKPTSAKQFFDELISILFCHIQEYGNAAIRSSIYYYKV